MAADEGDKDVLLLVHQVPVNMEDGPAPRLAHLLSPLHREPPPPPPPPFRPPPPPQAAASAEHRISFRGWLGIPRHWDDWVAKLRPVHGRLWRHLGIHDAVLASTLRYKRDASGVLHLASFWCPATNTFAFPWGEATVTLQDVAVLAGFPVLGAPAPGPLPPQWRPDEAALNGVRLGFNRSSCKKAHHSAWVKHFLTAGDGGDPVFEHAAFLALWLTRFVLPGHPESTMRQAVFPIAVRLARGERVALAPAVLASIYRDLREIKAFLLAAGAAAATAGDADMLSSLSVYSPLHILQLWMWERFPALRPTKVNPVGAGDPLAARWHDLSRKLNPAQIRQALNTGYNFVWRPYVSSMEHIGWVHSSDLAGNDELRSLAHFLRPSELVGMDCIEQYLPHRVARQFGLDQDVPGDVPRANQGWAIAWQTYQLDGKNVALFIPHSEPGMTARYAQWWRQQLLPSHIDAAAVSAPVEWKPSKRKVKKTPAAMEAEAEKERRMKKARVSPATDKKRKLEELYDTKLSGWLPTARNEISDTTSDIGLEEALLPNVGTTNDDIVLLMPKKQTTTAPVTASALMDNDMTPSLEERGNFIFDELPDIPSVPAAGVPAMLEEETVKVPVVTSLDIPDKPVEGSNAVMEEQKEGTSVTALMDNDMTPALGERGNFMVDEPPDIPGEPEAGVPATLEEEIVQIPLAISLDNPGKPEGGATVVMEEHKETTSVSDRSEEASAPVIEEVEEKVAIEGPIPDKPEGGATAVMEEQKEATSVCDRSEEASAPVIEEVEEKVAIEGPIPDKPEEGATAVMEEQKEATSVSDRSEEASTLVIEVVEEKVAIEGPICVTGMNPSGNNTAVVIEADETNAVPKEFGRAAEEGTEAVPQSQHEVDARIMNNSHDAVALPEEAAPVQPINDSAGCPVVSHVMEGSNVAGDSGKNYYENTSCDFVEEQKEIPCVEEIAGENSRMGEKERKETSHESPQLEIVECVQDIDPVETECDVEQKIVHPAVEDAATSNIMSPALLGVPEPENAELNNHPYLANKDAEDIPMEVAQGEVELEQNSTSAKGGAEEHEEFSEVDHMGTADAKLHLYLNSEVPEKVNEVERTEVDGTLSLTGRDSDKKLRDAPEVGYAEDESIRGLVVDTSDRKPSEVSQAEPAEMEDSKDVMEEDTDKSENVPGVECTGLEETHGVLMKDCTNNKSENVAELENTGLGGIREPIEDTDGRLKEIHDVNSELEKHNVHENDIDRSEGIMQIDPLAQGEARCLEKEQTEDNSTKVQEVKYEQLRNEALIQEDTKEKPFADSKDLSENVVHHSKEVEKSKEVEGEGCQVLMEKDMEKTSDAFVLEQTEDGHRKSLIETSINNHNEITLVEQLDGQSERLARTGTEEIHGETIKAQEKEFNKDVEEDSDDSTNDKDVVEYSNNSLNAEMMPCSSATELKEDKMEVIHEGKIEEPCVEDVELINQREPSSDLKEDKMEVIHEGKIEEPCVQDVELINQMEPSSDATSMEIEAVVLEQDNRIIHKNMEATTVEDSHTLDSGLNSDLDNVDETHAAREIKNQEILDVDMQVALDERQDLQAVTGNDKRNMSEDTGTSVCGEYQINSTGTEDVKSTKELQNQECLDQKEQLAREERDNLGITTENNNMNMLEDADGLVCGQYQNDPTHTKVKLTKGIQNQELLNDKEDQIMDERVEFEITDGSGVSDEEACKLGDGVNTSGVAMDVSDPVLNKEACNTEELQAREDKQHHGVGHANEKRILEDTSMIDTGELKSDLTIMDVSLAGLSEGTLNPCASSLEKEEAVQEKHDQGVVDENTNRGSADIDALECEGANPDVAMKMFHETILTTEAVNIAGSKILSENKQKEAPFEEHSITEVKGSESNESARKEPEGALPQEPGNLVKIKQESLENGTEMSIFRENDKASGKHHTSTEFIIAPSNMDERGDNDNGWPDESAKGCERLTSDSINTVRSIKFGKPSSEEVKRTQNTKSMYLKDIKDSLGRIRTEPSNRVHTTSVGSYSWNAVQDPISSCKEIKVPLQDSARDFGRDRALELVVTSPQEETPRWRQEQYALQILEDVQNSRSAEKSRMEMEIRVLKAQIGSMERQVMNLDHFSEVKSRSSLNQQMLHLHKPSF